MKSQGKLRQITLTYDCPILKKTVKKNVNEYHFTINEASYPWWSTVDVEFKCKCGKTHNFDIIK